MNINKVLYYIEENHGIALDKLFQLLEIPSISTSSANKIDCVKAADWLVTYLKEIGFQASAKKTSGNPIVLATAGKGYPHLLFYGHYDVQPVDPVTLWKSDPFKPVVLDKKGQKIIQARGASDDKGQLLTFIEACRAIIKLENSLPCKITIMIEGEEENGSNSLRPFIQKYKNTLNAECALICDTTMWNSKTPSISTMLRGMVGEEVTISASEKDLHSGMYGGVAVNPIHVLSNIIATLHTGSGSIAINDFYKGTNKIPLKLERQWKKLKFSEKKFVKENSLSGVFGEKNFSVLEKLWARPTCEINGIWGGYIENGFKTVIPSKASAKISFRLVGNQDPEEIRENFRSHVRERVHPGCRVDFEKKGGSKAIEVALDSKYIKGAEKALLEEWGKPAVLAGCGGSIPVVSYLKEDLNLDSLLIGFALEDDQIHSPNEKYNISSFYRGIRSWARIINQLIR